MTSSRDVYVAKHTAAVHIENKLSLLERKVFNILLKNARNGKEGDIYTIHIKDLSDLLDSKSATNYEFLKEVLHGLVERSLRFNILNKDKKQKWESSISILSEVHYDGGVVYYRPSQSFIDVFMKPSSYAYLNIKYQNLLSSKHSLALWEYCCEQLDSSKTSQMITPYIGLAKLKELLGAEGQVYEEYKVFNSKVLKKAVDEVNKKTDIKIEAVLVKKVGSRVDALAFTITRSSNVLVVDNVTVNEPQLELLDTDIIATINETFEMQDLVYEAMDIGIASEGLSKFCDQYSVQEIRNGIKLVKQKLDEGMKIKNIPGYLWTVLDQGVVETIDIDAEIKKKQKGRLYEGLMKFKDLPDPINKFFSTFADLYEMQFINWLSHLDFVGYDDGILTLYAPSSFFSEWITNNLASHIGSCGRSTLKGFKNFILVDKIPTEIAA